MTTERVNAPVVDAAEVEWDQSHDVVVVGAGAGGFATGLTLASQGADVTILEKGAAIGGSMRKAAAGYWVPNHRWMKEDGKVDDREETLKYLARVSRPTRYDADHPTLGLDAWEYEGIVGFFDHGPDALDALEEIGAIRPFYAPGEPTYHDYLPECVAPHPQLLFPVGDFRYGHGDGEDMAAHFQETADRLDVPVLVDHRVVSAVVEDGRVVGVLAEHDGRLVALRAEQGVVFASGGFTHNQQLRENFLHPAILGGSAASTNTGDFVAIAEAVGAPLRNMNNPWMAPILVEPTLAENPYNTGLFAVPGDSMIWVDRFGRRAMNEKGIYHDVSTQFFGFDQTSVSYPRMLMFMIWDQRAMGLWRASVTHGPDTVPSRLALDGLGNVMYEDIHLVKGDDLDALAADFEAHLERISQHTSGFALADEFRSELPATIARFNEMAERGKDEDFGRGEKTTERHFNGPARENDLPNPTMYPISTDGPYYGAIVSAGTIDTKGGPRTTLDGEVLGVGGEPIPGLYAVGNCVASPSGEGYWTGGSTIGPIMTFGWLAAKGLLAKSRV